MSLNNLYDQYSLHENRATNALLQTLAPSNALIQKFLRKFLKLRWDSRKHAVDISCQKCPFELGDIKEKEEDSNNIPDGWIINDEEDWAVVIESKINDNSLRLEQLQGHLKRISHYGKRILLTISPDDVRPEILDSLKKRGTEVHWCSWAEIHRWASKELKNGYNRNRTADYLLKNFKEYLEMDSNLSRFQGIEFEEGYTYKKAKETLRSLMRELQPKVVKLYPELTETRKKITDSHGSVWDYFGVVGNFTSTPHLTVSINTKGCNISLTMPNQARGSWRNLRKILANENSKRKFLKELSSIRRTGPSLWISFGHRHFIGMTRGISDGNLEFNFDTLRGRKQIKKLPLWFEYFEKLVLQSRKVNKQVGFRIRYLFEEDKILAKPEFANRAIKNIKAFKGLYKMLR